MFRVSFAWNVLIVEDELINRQLLIKYLSQPNYRITQASSGQEALDLLEKGLKPDLILLGLIIPLMTGYEVTRKIRQIWSSDELPIIWLSANNQEDDFQAGLEAGANDFLTQPICKSELLIRITTHINLSRLKQETHRLKQEREELHQENSDLKILLETSTEHGDTLVDQLHNQTEEVVEESERRLAQFLEAVPVGVVVFDQRGKLYFMNQKAQDIFGNGIDREAPLEKLSEVYHLYQAGTNQLYPLDQLPIVRSLKGESATANDLDFHQGETIIPLEVWSTPIYDADGTLTYSINAVQDITQHKQTAQLLADYNSTLEKEVIYRTQELSQTLDNLKVTQNQLIESEKMAALGNLVAGIAHEINTPIGTAILTASFLENETQAFVRTWEKGFLKRSELNEYLATATESSQLILRNLQRAGELVQNFKQMAVDQTSLEKRTFPLKTYLEEALFSLTPQLKQTRHTLTIEGDETLILDSYPGALSQVVTNLVLNSITHAYQPNEPGQLRFQVTRHGGRAIIHYTDDGCGIPTCNLSKIFEPFFTTARQKGGSGLGLHIVYNLVTQTLQGTICCESEIEVGTTFIINLPIVLSNES